MTIRESLSAELTDAMRRRDTAVVSALRTVLAAVANVEAAPQSGPSGGEPASAHLAGSTPGLGSTEVPRIDVADDQVRAIVTRERAELVGHAERLTRLCRRDEANAARRGANSLAAVLAEAEMLAGEG